MADGRPSSRDEGAEAPASAGPGWREVLLLVGSVVAVVVGAAILTGLLPPPVRDLVVRTPLTILVLVVGTAWLLWRIARRGPGGDG